VWVKPGADTPAVRCCRGILQLHQREQCMLTALCSVEAQGGVTDAWCPPPQVPGSCTALPGGTGIAGSDLHIYVYAGMVWTEIGARRNLRCPLWSSPYMPWMKLIHARVALCSTHRPCVQVRHDGQCNPCIR
jgi:hypothetical protein